MAKAKRKKAVIAKRRAAKRHARELSRKARRKECRLKALEEKKKEAWK